VTGTHHRLDPGQPARRGVRACDRRVIAGELTIGGMTRRFTLRLPRGAGGEIPLVLVLHGNHPEASGAQMREWTSFDQQADAWGFAVAYPDGYGGGWADGRGVTTADEAGVDDVAFLRAVIGWSAGRHGTSGDRAVAAGISNGAFMAHRMGAEASDQVAVLAAEFSRRVTGPAGVAGTRVVAWTVLGGGHTWPGSEPYPGTEQLTSREFDAAAEICRFAQPLLASAAARRL
jgi:poly(3-hydroxybutyrate) depolymerase